MSHSDVVPSSGRLPRVVANLFPGYFALVMATGIVSIATKLVSLHFLAVPLLWINVVTYAVLSGLTIARLVLYPRRIIRDLCDHGRGAGFFTLVAGTCVFGTQVLVVGGEAGIAHILWFVGIALWLIIMYAFFTAVVIRENKPTLETGINGAWLIAIVATQGVSVLGALLAPHVADGAPIIFFALCMYLLGAMLYLTIITLIFYRFTFVKMTMEGLTPPYWINMGAVAITTLAGSTLLLGRHSSPFTEMLAPFLTGFTLFFWVTATWWIPLLVILGIWRHGVRRYPLTYDPGYWGMVFPLGMYTVSTFRLSQAADLSFLRIIPDNFVYLAVAAWIVTFVGMLASFLKPAAKPVPAAPPT